MISIGVIGYGYWGPNLVRNFMDLDRFRVGGISDFSDKRRAAAASRCPGAKITESPMALIEDPSIDAIAIATPVSTHFELAAAALRAGKHVLVEKPITASSDEAKQLVDLAAKHGRTLMVDHTFVYNGAIRKVKDLIDRGSLGDVLYYDSVRVNLGLFQHDVNVIWDLAVHDVSIVQYLFAKNPTEVSAIGMSHVKGQTENVAYVTLMYDEPLLVHLHVNWLAPVKIRQTLIGGTKQMVVYDDVETSEKVKVYDKGVELETRPDRVHELRVGYRSGDMFAPKIDSTEALRVMATHFADCVESGKKPLTDGEAGLGIVQVLEAATFSMRHRGRPTKIGVSETL